MSISCYDHFENPSNGSNSVRLGNDLSNLRKSSSSNEYSSVQQYSTNIVSASHRLSGATLDPSSLRQYSTSYAQVSGSHRVLMPQQAAISSLDSRLWPAQAVPVNDAINTRGPAVVLKHVPDTLATYDICVRRLAHLRNVYSAPRPGIAPGNSPNFERALQEAILYVQDAHDTCKLRVHDFTSDMVLADFGSVLVELQWMLLNPYFYSPDRSPDVDQDDLDQDYDDYQENTEAQTLKSHNEGIASARHSDTGMPYYSAAGEVVDRNEKNSAHVLLSDILKRDERRRRCSASNMVML